MPGKRESKSPSNQSSQKKPKRSKDSDNPDGVFTGDPVPADEARQRWPHRYRSNEKKKGNSRPISANNEDDSEVILQARYHYLQAEIDGHVIFNLNDDAHVKADDGEAHYICKIVEMFESVKGTLHFTAQWFYRAKDTVIGNTSHLINDKRVFFSEIRDDNPLDCLVEKLKIAKLPPNVDVSKSSLVKDCDYYCDMLYLLPYTTFLNLPTENTSASSEPTSTVSSVADLDGAVNELKSDSEDVTQVQTPEKEEMTLVDVFSGCGAMSTGLCLGATLAGVNLITKWAVDFNKDACDSLKLNHSETEVRNEPAQDYLSLLKEWEKLCIAFSLIEDKNSGTSSLGKEIFPEEEGGADSDTDDDKSGDNDPEVFEVQKILAICYGDPKQKEEHGLYLKVRWKGYGPSEDTWEPISGLSGCREKIQEFVTNGYKTKALPLPGDVDVICGGPPCQGISGFNRFRNKENPLDDPKNKQLVVFMDIVDHLKPRFVLMENVVDLLRFADGFLARYALGRLVQMNYQARMGMMAAGCYGLPQFRNRVFLWGARYTENLPQYPLPTHDLVVRGNIPTGFERNMVAYNEGDTTELEKKLLLKDAISDLPAVTNYEERDEMPYGKAPLSDFQRFIRLRKEEMLGSVSKASRSTLYDHRPLILNEDDYQRVCQIPKQKGACFRDLPGVRVGSDNKVEWDPNVARKLLPSGKPLVPDYAMTFKKGSSSDCFARLWWDETVPTVVTRAQPHNRRIVHPEQDRVLTVRENARLQGFPDYYQLRGSIKARYIQVGNAVAVPVSRALGYSLGLASQGSILDKQPLLTLPPKFPKILVRESSSENDS